MMNEKVKDNTDEIMKGERMIITVNVKTALKRLIMILLVIFWIIGVAKPEFFRNMVNKTKEKKAETTISKEIVMIEKSSMYIAMFNDGTYIASDDLAGLAEKLSEETNKTFAAEDGKLKMVDGGMISAVDIAIYRK